MRRKPRIMGQQQSMSVTDRQTDNTHPSLPSMKKAAISTSRRVPSSIMSIINSALSTSLSLIITATPPASRTAKHLLRNEQSLKTYRIHYTSINHHHKHPTPPAKSSSSSSSSSSQNLQYTNYINKPAANYKSQQIFVTNLASLSIKLNRKYHKVKLYYTALY